jgi:hypothetical protein
MVTPRRSRQPQRDQPPEAVPHHHDRVIAGDVPRRGVRAFRRAGQRRGVYAGMSWAGATSLVVGVSRAMDPSER